MGTTDFGPLTLGLRSVLRGDATAWNPPSMAIPWPCCSSQFHVRRASSPRRPITKGAARDHRPPQCAGHRRRVPIGTRMHGYALPVRHRGRRARLCMLDSACSTLRARWRSARWQSTRTTRRIRNLCNAIGRHRPVLEGGHGDRVYRWRATVGLNRERTGFGRSALCLP